MPLALYKAALRGEWDATRAILEQDPVLSEARVAPNLDTALHIAVGTGKAIPYLENLVKTITNDALFLKNSHGKTALHVAALMGNLEAARILVESLPNLLYEPDTWGVFPIVNAAMSAHRPTIDFFISQTKDNLDPNPYADDNGVLLLNTLIDSDFFDIALDLISMYPDLAKRKHASGHSALRTIALKDAAFASGARLHDQLWERFIYSCETFPVAVYSAESNTKRFFLHMAVENRCEKVFNLIYQMSGHKHQFAIMEDRSGNTLLHLVATLAPPHKLNLVSGAALQMQRELQWFKEVEKYVQPQFDRDRRNYEGKTPKMIFTEEHSNLKAEGERWMKDTANSCSIAAALIATVVFAAAITVPGGNAESGYPLFARSSAFIIFAISDALSLFTSSTSLLMFLAILTSRYAEEDFLYALPKRLCVGLFTLFLSILSMMAAFSATIYLVFGRKSALVLIPVAVFACLPVTSFVLLQFPLLVDVTSSTYGRGIFGKQSDRPFH
ncbi:hypothetical protein C2S51_001968 [Perilla frutescens var. frutescens]|nr:hypothetical protein C2S51_001968 [Perilla frutescens var. frutescens]